MGWEERNGKGSEGEEGGRSHESLSTATSIALADPITNDLGSDASTTDNRVNNTLHVIYA